jgi:carbamoylphosphate synthase large subunit
MAVRVLYCLNRFAGRVDVVCSQPAKELRLTRYCRKVYIRRFFAQGKPCGETVAWINAHCRDNGIRVALPVDREAAAFLAAARGDLEIACPPVSGAALLNLMHDKWRFGEAARAAGLPVPPTVYADRADAVDWSAIDALGYPLLVKALSLASGVGMQRCDSREQVQAELDRRQARAALPVILQRLIPGKDACVNVLADRGTVIAMTMQVYPERGVIDFVDSPVMSHIGRELVRLFEYSGVANFDLRRADDGSFHILECNPRFWHSVPASMARGVNFPQLAVRMALGDRPQSVQVRLGRHYVPRGLVGLILRPGRAGGIDAGSLRALRDELADPLPALWRTVERRLPWSIGQGSWMTAVPGDEPPA